MGPAWAAWLSSTTGPRLLSPPGAPLAPQSPPGQPRAPHAAPEHPESRFHVSLSMFKIPSAFSFPFPSFPSSCESPSSSPCRALHGAACGRSRALSPFWLMSPQAPLPDQPPCVHPSPYSTQTLLAPQSQTCTRAAELHLEGALQLPRDLDTIPRVQTYTGRSRAPKRASKGIPNHHGSGCGASPAPQPRRADADTCTTLGACSGHCQHPCAGMGGRGFVCEGLDQLLPGWKTSPPSFPPPLPWLQTQPGGQLPTGISVPMKIWARCTRPWHGSIQLGSAQCSGLEQREGGKRRWGHVWEGVRGLQIRADMAWHCGRIF